MTPAARPAPQQVFLPRARGRLVMRGRDIVRPGQAAVTAQPVERPHQALAIKGRCMAVQKDSQKLQGCAPGEGLTLACQAVREDELEPVVIFDACRPGDRSHSLMWEPVSAGRALLIRRSRPILG